MEQQTGRNARGWALAAMLCAGAVAADPPTPTPRSGAQAGHEAPAAHGAPIQHGASTPHGAPIQQGAPAQHPAPGFPPARPSTALPPGPRAPSPGAFQAPATTAPVPAQTTATTPRKGMIAHGPVAAPPASPHVPMAVAHDALHAAPVSLDARTALQARVDRSGYRVAQVEPHGTNLVVAQHRTTGGETRVVAYRETASPGGGTVARLYADGHRVVEGANFRSVGVAGHAQYLTYKNGLRAAYLPSGRPLYAERYVTTTVGAGSPVRALQRLSYRRYDGPDGNVGWIPFVRSYPWVATIAGIELFAYLAPPSAPAYYLPLYRPVAVPIVVGPGCSICPTGDVGFEEPPQTYADPMDLVGDRVIGDPLATPAATDQAPPTPAPTDQPATGSVAPDPVVEQATEPPPPPEMVTGDAANPAAAAMEIAALRSATAALQSRVDRQAATTPALADSLPQAHAIPAVLIEATPDAGRAAPGAATLMVPREAQEQLRKEVRYAVALQRNGHSLALPEILHADYGKIFVFQATVPIDVTWTGNSDQCTLGPGDLLDFASAPAADAQLVDMHVITSRAGHCPAGAGVQLGVSDLQDMLNSFSERVEREARVVNSCLAPGGACVRL